MSELEDRLAAGKAMADEAWAQTLRAMYEGGSLLAQPGYQAVDTGRCTCGTGGVYGHEHDCGLEVIGPVPIESDALDRRDQARQDAEDAWFAERCAAWEAREEADR